MEKWEALVEQYPSVVNHRMFIKTIKTAQLVLKEDLASFEKDWYIDTLLNEPVQLLKVIDSKHAEEGWAQSLEAALKLIADVVTGLGDAVQQHHEDIVQVCQLRYDTKTRNQALMCLTQVVKQPTLGALDVDSYIDQLLSSTTCKAQLASLVGTICEYHPDKVGDKAETLLRAYLSTNMLDSNKNSDAIMCSALQGLASLFKNFGNELPTAQLRTLYVKLTKEFILRSKCDKVVVQILEKHASLFVEQVSCDGALRQALWRELAREPHASLATALRALYSAALHHLAPPQLQKIIDEEVLPQLESNRLSKYTAMRVLAAAKKEHDITAAVDVDNDVHVLEFELRHGKITHAVADDVTWCLESNIVNSEQLLQTAIMFFTNLPATKVKETVVYNLLTAPDHIRKSSVIFLITESCQDATSLEKFRPLWKVIFSCFEENDENIVKGVTSVFEDFIEYVATLLEIFLEEQCEMFPASLSAALLLSRDMLRAHPAAGGAGGERAGRRLLRLATRALSAHAAHTALVAAGAELSLALHLTDEHVTRHFYQMLDVDACMDEELLKETCAALVYAPAGLARVDTVLDALHIIVSSSDTSSIELSAAIRKLDSLLSNPEYDLDKNIVDQILCQVEKLRTRKLANGKNDRILRREVLMFLGKFGEGAVCGSPEQSVDTHEPLALTVQNPIDRLTYKIELHEILQLAEAEEDSDALRSILAVVCANRSWSAGVLCGGAARSARGLRACAALARAPDTAPAATLTHVLPYIMCERRWGVRRLLCAGAVSLVSAQGDDALAAALDRALLLADTTLSTSKRAGLDLIEALMVPLNDNNDISQKYLPDILIRIVKAFEINSDAAFDAVSQVFLDKVALFDEHELRKLQRALLEAVISDKMEVVTDDMRIYKLTVKKIIDFLKHQDVNNIEFDEINIKRFYVAVQARRSGVEALVNILAGPRVLEQTLVVVLDAGDWFQVDAYLMFLEDFADSLLKDNADATMQRIADVLSQLAPETITRVKMSLMSCVKLYMKSSGGQNFVNSSVNKWCARVPMEQITQDLENNIFNTDYDVLVSALNILTDLGCRVDETNKTFMRRWPRLLYKMTTLNVDYPVDLLQVGMRCLTESEVKDFILNGHGITSDCSDEITRFCRVNMCVFFEYLVKKPYLLAESSMAKCCVLLNDVVQWYVQRKCPREWSDVILDLVDQVWSSYESQMPLGRKVALLQDMRRLPQILAPESSPMRWVVKQMARGDVGDMISLVTVLPPGETYESSFLALASHLPTRVRELRGVSNAVFRALADAAADGDPALLRVLATLASGDETSGWWEEALECCMASLALRHERAACDLLHERCWDGHSLAVCERLYLPLIRNSSTTFCEEYLPEVVVNALSKFKGSQVRPAPGFAYRKQVAGYAIAFSIIQLALEKLSSQTLELSTSRLNTLLGATQPWHVIRESAKLAVDYTTKYQAAFPPATDRPLADLCRQAQCSAYACACVALRRRRPSERLYLALFAPTLWPTLVDPDIQIDLPLPSHGVVRTMRHTVSAEECDVWGVAGTVGGTAGGTARSASSSTRRTRLFLRTLSQNPLEHDREPTHDDGPEQQEVEVHATWLNSLRVTRDVTALVRHVAARQFDLPRRLADALTQDMHENAKLMLAQVICNCGSELSPYAASLRPALFHLLAENDELPLNSLHLDILTTLSQWRDDVTLADPTHLNTAVVRLVLGIINNRHRKYAVSLLSECMNKLLEVYGPMVTDTWTMCERYFYHESVDMQKCFMKILQIFIKNKVYITGMVQAIILKLEESHLPSADVSKLLGGALRSRREPAALAALAALLDRAPAHVHFLRTLYYAQTQCDACCTHTHFKKVTDLLPRVPDLDKKKCLRIIASFLAGPNSSSANYNLFKKLHLNEYIKNEDDDLIEEAIKVVKCGLHLMDSTLKRGLVELVAEHCRHSSEKVREAALDVVTKVLQEYGVRGEGGVSAVVEAREPLHACAVRAVSHARRALPRRAAPALDPHMPMRFAESFYLAVYLPAVEGMELDLCEIAATFLETLFSGIMNHDEFKNLRLRNEPLQITAPSSVSSFTLSVRDFTTGNGTLQQPDTCVPVVDIQTPVVDILSNLFQFAKVNVAAAVRLVCAVTRCVVGEGGADGAGGAGGAARVGALLAELLAARGERGERGTGPSAVTPLLLELARVLLPHIAHIQGFQQSVERLRSELMGTEGEDLVTLLYEEVLLINCGPELFVLGLKHEDMEVDMVEPDRSFSIQDLVSSFGKLTNWNNLTLQQKRRIERSLPPLWTDHDTFRAALQEYDADGEGWFEKLVCSCRGSQRRRAMHWMRDLQRWPARHFLLSAVSEAIEWQRAGDVSRVWRGCGTRGGPRGHCLAECAARLMIRALFLSEHGLDEAYSTCAHELDWCVRASETTLYKHVAFCTLRHLRHKCTEDKLSWSLQDLLARRTRALDQCDVTQLARVLEDAEKCTLEFPSSNPVTLLHINHLRLQLRHDLNRVSIANVEETLAQLDKQWSSLEALCLLNKKIVHDTLHLAMTCYYELWSANDEEEYQRSVVSGMCSVVERALGAGAGTDALVAALLDRAWARTHPRTHDDRLIHTIESALPRLSPFAAQETLCMLRERCPGRLDANALPPQLAERADMFRTCLQLLCDPRHTLATYCLQLAKAVRDNDPVQWSKTFEIMNQKLFENHFLGTDFQLLGKHKSKLYAIKEYGATDSNKKLSVLRELEMQMQRPAPQGLRLSQLCRTLAGEEVRADTHLAALLNLPPGLTLLSFDEQVSVVTDSIRRPCVVRAVLSDGSRRRYLHKLGDRPRLDAAVLHVAAALLPHCTTYTVKPLSEDCALIEFLEDHERLDTLIGESCDLSQLIVPRDDEDLILRPAAERLHAFQQRCERVPAHALRTSLEKRSASLEDFVRKKTRFLESVASTTLLCWLLGVGDRHTQNVLVCGDGRAACVDWADALQHGGARDLPPARLTRNMLALLDNHVLESRLQQQLSKLRDNATSVLAVIKFAFHWMGDEFNQKLKYIEGLLRGKYLPHHVTKMALEEKRYKHYDKYMELLDHVFQDYEHKDQYSVEEQVSCLLRQCTDPRILSVTRYGWQPWM